MIQQTKLFVFFLSENGNKSKQVLKEINLAIEFDIPILVFCTIKQCELSYALRYYLGDIHINFCDSFNDSDFQKTLDDIICMYNDTRMPYDIKTHSKRNLDNELNDKFHELFDDTRNLEPEDVIESEQKSVEQLLYEILYTNLEKDIIWNENDEEEYDESELADDFFDFDDENIEYVEGGHFSTTENSEVEQYGYEILFEIQEDTLKKVPYLVSLDCIQKKSRVRNIIRRTFFVDISRKISNLLLFVTNINDLQISYLNFGILNGNEISWTELGSVEWSHTKNEEKEEFIIDEQSDIILIDPTVPEPIKKHRKYNHTTGEYETTIDLYGTKKYIAFKFNRSIASSFEMGYAYYFGDFGLEKNNMKAARWFLQSDEPWAYFYLGQIFRFDSLLNDSELSDKYFALAKKWN